MKNSQPEILTVRAHPLACHLLHRTHFYTENTRENMRDGHWYIVLYVTALSLCREQASSVQKCFAKSYSLRVLLCFYPSFLTLPLCSVPVSFFLTECLLFIVVSCIVSCNISSFVSCGVVSCTVLYRMVFKACLLTQGVGVLLSLLPASLFELMSMGQAHNPPTH